MHVHDIQHSNIIEIIEQYLKENYKKEISLNDIASYFNFSQDYLSKLLKNIQVRHLIF
ncbi:helix-turn-helix transcriptional regulator [Caldicellulosiruptoraceae bacterium PP1]